MTIIKEYVDNIKEELCDAKKYAEQAVLQKAKGNTILERKYREMAEDELKHAEYLHQITTDAIAELRNVFVPTQTMLDLWEHSHNEYVDKASWIRQMLAM